MRVLFLTGTDNGNSGWRFSECVKLLGYDVETLKVAPTKSNHPQQMTRMTPPYGKKFLYYGLSWREIPSLKKYADSFDIIHYMHTTFIDTGINLTTKNVIVNHGGSRFRNNAKHACEMFNRIVDFSIVQTPSLMNLGAKNEVWIVTPVNTDFIYPDNHSLGKTLRIGHYPSSPKKKGTDRILPVIKDFGNKINYVGATSLLTPNTFVPWERNLQRIKQCDVIIETLKTDIDGRVAGGWGSSALEAAAAGTIVITNYLQKDIYLKEYGEIPFLVANTQDELRERLREVVAMTDSEIKKLKEKTRQWAVDNHSFVPTSKRLVEKVYGQLPSPNQNGFSSQPSSAIRSKSKEVVVRSRRKGVRRTKPASPIIKKTVIYEDPIEFGERVLVEDYTVMRPNIKIGDNTEIRQFCFLAGNITIGKNVKIFQYSNIGKGSVIEDGVYIGARVLLLNTRKISHGRQYAPNLQAPVIKRGARIGSGAIILPNVTIGEECMIAAGSVVTKDTDPFFYYVGNPARKWKPVPEEERLLILFASGGANGMTSMFTG